MAVKLFAMGEVGQGHAFGGLCQGDNPERALECGLDFGSGDGIEPGSRIGQYSLADKLFIFRISDSSAERFTRLVGGLHMLLKVGRLPYYFSRGLKVSRWLEQNQPPLEFDGSPSQNLRPSDFYSDSKRFLSKGNAQLITDPDAIFLPGLRYVRANCISFLYGVAALSGIDLKSPLPAPSMPQPDLYEQACKESFNTAAGGKPLFCDYLHGKIYDETNNLSVAAIAMPRLAKGMRISEMVEQVSINYGGFKNLKARFKDAAAFERPPAPIPFYLADQFREIGWDMSGFEIGQREFKHEIKNVTLESPAVHSAPALVSA